MVDILPGLYSCIYLPSKQQHLPWAIFSETSNEYTMDSQNWYSFGVCHRHSAASAAADGGERGQDTRLDALGVGWRHLDVASRREIYAPDAVAIALSAHSSLSPLSELSSGWISCSV